MVAITASIAVGSQHPTLPPTSQSCAISWYSSGSQHIIKCSASAIFADHSHVKLCVCCDMHCPAAFDKDDLLYLRDKEQEQRLQEQHKRDAEAAAFAAARARAEAQAEQQAAKQLRQQEAAR